MAVNPKVRDLSILLPLAGVLLLMSPVLEAFNSLKLVIGIPVIVLYIFGVWLGLIILGAWLSRFQREAPPPETLPPDAVPPASPPSSPPSGALAGDRPNHSPGSISKGQG